MRESPFQDPGIRKVDMKTLVGFAAAIEHVSARRYRQLADAMHRRGQAMTAAAFEALAREEAGHIAAVDRWTRSLGEDPATVEDYEHRLPPEFEEVWEDVAGSALLTPYRAYAIAVENEMRAFAFYAHLAAHATSDRVRVEAEKMASEELRHARLLRTWRRKAWHRTRPGSQRVAFEKLDSPAVLRGFIHTHEARIGAEHGAIAGRLRKLGDTASAELLEQMLPIQGPGSPQFQPHPGAALPEPDPLGPPIAPAMPKPSLEGGPLELMVAAQAPLEHLADQLEGVMRQAGTGPVFEEAKRSISDVVDRLARVALRSAELEQSVQRRA